MWVTQSFPKLLLLVPELIRRQQTINQPTSIAGNLNNQKKEDTLFQSDKTIFSLILLLVSNKNVVCFLFMERSGLGVVVWLFHSGCHHRCLCNFFINNLYFFIILISFLYLFLDFIFALRFDFNLFSSSFLYFRFHSVFALVMCLHVKADRLQMSRDLENLNRISCFHIHTLCT